MKKYSTTGSQQVGAAPSGGGAGSGAGVGQQQQKPAPAPATQQVARPQQPVRQQPAPAPAPAGQQQGFGTWLRNSARQVGQQLFGQGQQPAQPQQPPAPAPVQGQPAQQQQQQAAPAQQQQQQPQKPSLMTAAGALFGLASNPEGRQQLTDAMSHYRTVNNDDVPWTDPKKFQAAQALRQFLQSNPNAQTLLQSMPEMRQKAEEQFAMMDGPMGQVVRYGAPLLQHVTRTPEQFGQFLGMPLIKDIAQPAIQTLGMPGLMAAYSYLSGDSEKWKNWRTLTSGMRDPNNPRRREVEDTMSRLRMSEMLTPQGNSDRADDLIDRYLAQMRCTGRS